MEKGYYMKKRRGYPALIAFLWICFIATVGAAAYLSFQNGIEAEALGRQFTQYVADKVYSGRKLTEEELLQLTYKIRQTGRVIIFFLIGILGTATIHITFRKWRWTWKTGIAAGILLCVAYLTEKLKIYIPTRHYSYHEMMMSIAAVCMGFLLVSVITLCFYIFKNFFRLLGMAVH